MKASKPLTYIRILIFSLLGAIVVAIPLTILIVIIKDLTQRIPIAQMLWYFGYTYFVCFLVLGVILLAMKFFYHGVLERV